MIKDGTWEHQGGRGEKREVEGKEEERKEGNENRMVPSGAGKNRLGKT